VILHQNFIKHTAINTNRAIIIIIVIYIMQSSHLLTRSGLTYPEASSKVCHDSFCQLGNSVSLPWVIYYEAFYLHVVSSFSCIPVICLKLVLFLLENLSSFFPWDLPVVEISPEWVTGPEQGKSSGRIATFSLWTGGFISVINKEIYNPIKIIAYILKDWMQFKSRMDICVHAITVTDSYTSFSDTNKQTVLLLC